MKEIKDKLEFGDISQIAREVGCSPGYVHLALNGLCHSDLCQLIVMAATRIIQHRENRKAELIRIIEHQRMARCDKPHTTVIKDKSYCECGKPVVMKGRCRTCYMRQYRMNKKLGILSKAPYKNSRFRNNYQLVINELQNGLSRTIESACKKLGINRMNFYRSLNEELREGLRLAKSIGKHNHR